MTLTSTFHMYSTSRFLFNQVVTLSVVLSVCQQNTKYCAGKAHCIYFLRHFTKGSSLPPNPLPFAKPFDEITNYLFSLSARGGICLLSPELWVSILKSQSKQSSNNSCYLASSSPLAKTGGKIDKINKMCASSVLLHYDSYRVMVIDFNTQQQCWKKSVSAVKRWQVEECGCWLLIAYQEFWLFCSAVCTRSTAALRVSSQTPYSTK